jgi:hypothetical protein
LDIHNANKTRIKNHHNWTNPGGAKPNQIALKHECKKKAPSLLEGRRHRAESFNKPVLVSAVRVWPLGRAASWRRERLTLITAKRSRQDKRSKDTALTPYGRIVPLRYGPLQIVPVNSHLAARARVGSTAVAESRVGHFLIRLPPAQMEPRFDPRLPHTAPSLPHSSLTSRITGNTALFPPRHIKNISPNYPRDVLQMFDKRNMTITRAGLRPALAAAARPRRAGQAARPCSVTGCRRRPYPARRGPPRHPGPACHGPHHLLRQTLVSTATATPIAGLLALRHSSAMALGVGTWH